MGQKIRLVRDGKEKIREKKWKEKKNKVEEMVQKICQVVVSFSLSFFFYFNGSEKGRGWYEIKQINKSTFKKHLVYKVKWFNGSE